MTAFYAQQPFSPFGFTAPGLDTLPPTVPAHLRQPQASTSSTPSSSTSSSSSFAPALFSPSLFAPSPLSPSAGPAGGSYFTAMPDSMAYSYGLLQANQAGASFYGQQLPAFTPPQLQHQQQPARLTVIDDEASFWSTSPPPPTSRQTASLFEFESAGRPTTADAAAAAAAANLAADRADSASTSSFSVHTPTGSEDGAFDDLRAVDESERGDLGLLDSTTATTAVVRMERAGSEHSDGAIRSADGKGTTIAEVLEEMGISRKSYDRMTPAKKRQIRNKVSARAFRARKKSLQETLEATIIDKDHLIENLRRQITKLQAQNAKLESKVLHRSH